MRIHRFIVILSVLLPGCGPKIVGYLGITDSDASDTSNEPVDASTSSGSSTSTTSAGATTTSTSITTESTSTTSGEDSDGPVVPAECLAVDHETCYDAALAACGGQGTWDVTQACVDAVQVCYPIGTQALAPDRVIDACKAGVEETCQSQNAPGCSEAFCTCTAGAYPFDWNNCWHLLLLACGLEATSGCEAVLAACYPAATFDDYAQCRQQAIEDVGQEGACICTQCGYHEQCEDALDTCLGA